MPKPIILLLSGGLDSVTLARAPCPWPADVWTMTGKEYVKAIPNRKLRTRISGFLMRLGWEAAMKEVEKKMRKNHPE